MSFRRIEASAFVPVSRGRASKYDECQLGQNYFFAQGTGYRADDDNSEVNSELPKLGTIMSSIRNFANAKGWKAKIEVGKEKDTGVVGVNFSFSVKPVKAAK
jgi:hypothetical protein